MKRNIQRIALSIALAAAAFPFCVAQEVTRSAQIPGLRPYKVDLEYMPRAEKDSVRMVAELWKGYVESFTSVQTQRKLFVTIKVCKIFPIFI